MGTRHLTCVVQDDEFRVAQYGQWDGYPSGQGATILRFLEKVSLDQFREKVRTRVRWLDQEEFEERYKALGFPESGMMSMPEAETYKGVFPYLNRDLGAEILEEIYHATDIVEVRDESSFAHDSLMCEWAYIVDLDRNVLEVYKGFNEDPDVSSGRFASVPKPKRDYSGCSTEYHTVALVQTYQLDDLPSVETLVEQCEPREYE